MTSPTRTPGGGEEETVLRLVLMGHAMKVHPSASEVRLGLRRAFVCARCGLVLGVFYDGGVTLPDGVGYCPGHSKVEGQEGEEGMLYVRAEEFPSSDTMASRRRFTALTDRLQATRGTGRNAGCYHLRYDGRLLVALFSTVLLDEGLLAGEGGTPGTVVEMPDDFWRAIVGRWFDQCVRADPQGNRTYPQVQHHGEGGLVLDELGRPVSVPGPGENNERAASGLPSE